MLVVVGDAKFLVIMEGEVVVGRRRRHRAGVLRRRTQCPVVQATIAALSGQRRGRWCRVRAPSRVRGARPSKLFQQYAL